MGFSILDLVLDQLRQAGFQADVAYPGQMVPTISQPVAAVHIEKVDRAAMTVTVAVNVLCPASQGGTACEVVALRVTETLRWNGAVCVQNGCRYDGVAQVYAVEVLATYTGVAEEKSCTIWPGFYVYINNALHRFAAVFTEQEQTGAAAGYVMGESSPKGIHGGKRERTLYLEERIPAESPELEMPQGEFQLKIVTSQKTLRYTGCRWVSIERELTQQGLRKVCRGIALGREEVAV